MRLVLRSYIACVLVSRVAAMAAAQTPQTSVTLSDIRDRFRATNATVQAGQIEIDELEAAEMAAFLRPNPQWSLTLDQVGNTEQGNLFSASNLLTAFSHLHDRQQMRELRHESAEHVTAIAASAQGDLDRILMFTIRTAFIQVVQANLADHDQVLSLGRDRLQRRRHGSVRIARGAINLRSV
jgi:cobalt-zinc-cadmium efflux system outer membrane protein